jgi:hypothetical protein
MTDELTELQLQLVTDDDADPEEFAALTGILRRELLELDVQDVQPAAGGTPPAGAKGVELVAMGALLVKLVKSPGLLEAVAKTVGSWVERLGRRSVRIEIDGDVLEVTGASRRDQRALIQEWVRRQAER